MKASSGSWTSVPSRAKSSTTTSPPCGSGLSRPDVPGWPRPKWIAADPAGESTNSQSGISDVLLLRRNGFKVLTPRSHIHRGLLLIRQRLSTLARPRLFVHERCEKLIESFERYHYNLKDKEDPDPVKDGFDHAADAAAVPGGERG